MLGNGLGKSRASRDASLRKPASWRLLFLSTGEISLADKMAEDARNRRQTAGQQVRIIDLPSDTGNHGLFDNLHGFESAARLADHLRSASSRFYGTPIRKSIEAIAPELNNIAVSIKGSVQQFVEDNCPGDDCDGQVKRGCARFGLIGVAGELVTSLDAWGGSSGSRGMLQGMGRGARRGRTFRRARRDSRRPGVFVRARLFEILACMGAGRRG
jgi:putative DNA primase/helicase